MKVYEGLDRFTKIENAVVTTGTFDGVHIGHRTILNRLIELSRKVKGENVLLTFFPHPRMVLQEDSDLKLINTIEEKTQLLREAGIDHLIIQPFTKKFSRTSSLEFVRDILVNQIGTKKLVIGYDHHFGRNREGSFEHLKEYGPLYGFDVEEISAQEVDDVNVSSTKVRTALFKGKVEVANEYLGHQFMLNGKVVRGKQIGRTLGYPTANIEVENQYKLIPSNGIYAVKIVWNGKEYSGMLNIGTRPTLKGGDGNVSIEVNIFDFSAQIYEEKLEIRFIQRIRDEKKFDRLDDLIKAIKEDELKVRSILE